MRKIENPDVNNTDPSYWEKVLESFGLGLKPLSSSADVLDLPSDSLNLQDAQKLGLIDGDE